MSLNRDIPEEQMQQYIQTAKNRQQQRFAALKQRRLKGLKTAHTAAKVLKTEFTASRVVLFGSLLNDTFHENSDIDLAVWGLPEKFYFKAVAKLLSLSEFEFDLVETQYATAEILDAIAQGQEL